MMPPGCYHPAHELLDWYLNGTLDRQSELEVRSHLDSCDLCSAELRDLAGIASALSERESPPAARTGDGASRPRAIGVWLATAAAAVVTIAAALALFREAPGRGKEDTAVFTLDLGSGRTRSSEASRPIVIPPGARSVRVVLEVPPAESSSFSYDLVGPGEEKLLSAQPLRERDQAGRYAIVLPIERLERPGRYSLRVRGGQAADVGLVFTFPFEIESK